MQARTRSTTTLTVYVVSVLCMYFVYISTQTIQTYVHYFRHFVRKLPSVLCVAHFSRALDLMNHALSGRRLPGLQENMAYFTTTERRSVDSVQSPLSSAVNCCLAFMYRPFTSHAEKKQSLQLPWRREELVSSYVISMCNQLHYGIAFLCERWH